MDLNNILSQVVELSKGVGAFIAGELGKVTQSQVIEKEINSLVSYVDQEAERKLVKGLSAILPNSSFITEEKTTEEVEADYIWIIDPLDGTNNFLNGIPHFAISIALCSRESIVLAVVVDVMRNDFYTAIKGQGSYLNGHRLGVSSTHKISDALLATGFLYSNDYDNKHIMMILSHIMLHSRGVRRFGAAALDLAYVAAGRFTAYYENSLHIWDVAAGNLLVEEAGGQVSDWSGGKGYLDGSEVLASNGHLHQDLMHILQNP